jgi:hypothetical protein
MTSKEKRTVRLAMSGIAVYLALFFGFKAWKFGAAKRAEYRQLYVEAQGLKAEVKRYDDKIAVVKNLMQDFHMDPTTFTRPNVVAEASAAIQKAALGSGFQLGPIRETATRTSGKELGSIQFEGTGPLKGAMGLLNTLKTLGYPLIIDSMQIAGDPMRPEQMKLKLVIVVLDFDQWKTEGTPHA